MITNKIKFSKVRHTVVKVKWQTVV